MAWTLEEKRSEKTNANQPESGRLEEDAEAAEHETPPQPPEPLPPQQSLAAQPLALLSPPEEIGGGDHEGVMISKNMVAEVGGVMACDGGKGMMESMQMDKEEELLQQQPNQQQPDQQQPNQQQPQLPGAADPGPWPPSMSPGLDESNSEWEIGSHDFLVLYWEAEQQQGRLRLKNANRREAGAIASRRAIGSEKALALVGPSASLGVGGTRRPVGPPPVNGEHAREKR